jgi:hypothetical protein
VFPILILSDAKVRGIVTPCKCAGDVRKKQAVVFWEVSVITFSGKKYFQQIMCAIKKRQITSKMHNHPQTDLPCRKVIGHCITAAGYIFYPEIRNRIIYLKQVIHFQSCPKRFDVPERIACF